MIYIDIEDAVSNALIELLEKKNISKVTFKEVENYGYKVVEILTRGEDKVIFRLDRNRTNWFMSEYGDYFVFENNDRGNTVISFKEGIDRNCLINKFRGYLSLDALIAFNNMEALKFLGI